MSEVLLFPDIEVSEDGSMVERTDKTSGKRQSGAPPPPPSLQTWRDRWLTPQALIPIALAIASAIWAGTVQISSIYSEKQDTRIAKSIFDSEAFKKLGTDLDTVKGNIQSLLISNATINEKLRTLERQAFPNQIKSAEAKGIKDPQLITVGNQSGPIPIYTSFRRPQNIRIDVVYNIQEIKDNDIVVRAVATIYEDGLKQFTTTQAPPETLQIGKPATFQFFYKNARVIHRIAIIEKNKDGLVVATGEADKVTG